MRIKSFVAAAGVTAFVAALLALPAAAQQPTGPVAPVCANCHDAQWRAIDLTPHGAKNDADGSMCQACHGNAADHIKDPTKFKPANPFGRATPPTSAPRLPGAAIRAIATWRSGLPASTS